MHEKKSTLILKYIALISLTMFILVPFIWLFYSSFRTESAMFSGKFFENPNGLMIKHYFNVFQSGGGTGNFIGYFKNSILIAAITTLVVVTISVFGAYSLSRFHLKFKNAFIITMLLSNMFPWVLLVIPIFGLLFTMNLIDSYTGIIFPHIILGLPFSIWLIKGYFDGVPKELDEAAMIDGLGPFQTLIKVILPVAAPGIVVASFYSFMVSWGDFLFVSVISQSMDTKTLPIGLNNFFGSTQVAWGSINAATVISIIPTILLFSMLQKWIVEGLTSGAVKG
jgi:ABC-type glycerol-3-phosphate transport system permease component